MLDDTKMMASVDSEGMLGSVEAVSEHLCEGIRRGRTAGPPKATNDGVVICGVGGSAIGGDMLKAWLSTECDVRCEVARAYGLPRHVGRQSLVVVASYSGNTEETLSMLDDARSRTSKIVTVSSGGRLADISESLSLPHVRVPSGMVPRAAMLESLTTAVWLSVRLNASAYPLSIFAWCVSGSGLADCGGPISAVTANLPDSKTFSRLLPVFI